MIGDVPSRRIDGLTQWWVIRTGRRVDLLAAPWLQGPVGDRDVVGDGWLDREAGRLGARVTRSDQAGLLSSLDALDGPGFAAERLHPAIRDFYEHTAGWRLDLSVRWAPWAWPFGWLVATGFARRLQQLALPLRRRELAGGMTSTVTPVCDGRGQVAALWLRRLGSTGAVVYSGWYDTVQPARAVRPHLRVCFPLPRGRLVVLLAVDVTPTGGIRLSSTAGGWGDPGAYLVVENGRGTWARRVPVHEIFLLQLDGDGRTLLTDHDLRLWRLPAVQLHYRMSRADEDTGRSAS